jgi:hypothetical protein
MSPESGGEEKEILATSVSVLRDDRESAEVVRIS